MLLSLQRLCIFESLSRPLLSYVYVNKYGYADGMVVMQLNVRKCNECGQALPESFEPPADENWTTGIFGCAEDRESCKLPHISTTLLICCCYCGSDI